MTFALGAALAAVAGQFVTFTYSLMPSIGMLWTLKAMIVIVLAGTGSILGALPGGHPSGGRRGVERSVSRSDLQGGGRPGPLPARADPASAGSVREEMMRDDDSRQSSYSKPSRRWLTPAAIVVAACRRDRRSPSRWPKRTYGTCSSSWLSVSPWDRAGTCWGVSPDRPASATPRSSA